MHKNACGIERDLFESYFLYYNIYLRFFSFLQSPPPINDISRVHIYYLRFMQKIGMHKANQQHLKRSLIL